MPLFVPCPYREVSKKKGEVSIDVKERQDKEMSEWRGSKYSDEQKRKKDSGVLAVFVGINER